MNRHRTATILHFPHSRDRSALWGQVARHLGEPEQTARISRRPWGWLNAYAKRQIAARA